MPALTGAMTADTAGYPLVPSHALEASPAASSP